MIASRHVVESLWRGHPLGPIYRCHDDVHDRPVLLHRLDRAFADPGVRDRLFEARGRASLGSSLIPDVLDYGVDLDGRPFEVTRIVAGASLAELRHPIAFAEALELILDLATALAPAHAERLVHGGIEPASVIVQRRADGRARVVALLGFGLVPALEAGDPHQRSLPLRMTPTHVAPELVHGDPISPAADVYALGISLWALIHGAPPFRGPTLRVLDAHLHHALPELPLPRDVPPAFDWVLRRMLAKNPVDRFADAGALVEQLRGFMTDALPDLTGELEFDLDFELEPAELADDQEFELTIVFERAGVSETIAEPPLAAEPLAADPRLDDSVLDEPTRADLPIAKLVALLTLALALLLLAVQAL